MRPVFIGGCHRSGTTLLGALLGAHPDCLTTPESQFKTDALREFGVPGSEDEMRAAATRALVMRSLRRWGLEDAVLRHAVSAAGSDYAKFLSSLVSGYGRETKQESFEFWIDHTPRNVWHLQTLFSLFPDARAIHIVRDGRAVAASVMPLDWGPSTTIAAANWWVHHVAFGLAAESYYGKTRILRVRYEDLVSAPLAELGRICKWLDLDYAPEMSRGGGFKFEQGSFRYHSLIHDAPDASRATAWKNYLSDREICTFESQTSDFLGYLNYERFFPGAKTALIEKIRTLLFEPLFVVLNAVRFRYWRAKKERALRRSAVSGSPDA